MEYNNNMKNDPMAKVKIHSGGSSKGNFGKPHKFYDKAAAKYKSYGTSKANYDKDMAEERIQIKDDKEKIFEDDKEKRDSSPTKLTDLSGDGKVTKKDVLIGRGVLPKPNKK